MDNNPNLKEKTSGVLVKFFNDFAAERKLDLFFVCESDSRPEGIAVEDSDFDSFGLFLPPVASSLQVVPKVESIYKVAHNKVEIEGMSYDLDFELMDLREFARRKAIRKMYNSDYVLFSPVVHINKYPKLIDSIKERLKPIPDEFMNKFKNHHEICEKQIKRNGECLNKKILSGLVCGVKYFHTHTFVEFPEYDIWLGIDTLKEKLDQSHEALGLSTHERDLLFQVFENITYYYKQKRKGRKSVSQVIPALQYKFYDWLNTRFKMTDDLDTNSPGLTLENFQGLVDEIVSSWSH